MWRTDQPFPDSAPRGKSKKPPLADTKVGRKIEDTSVRKTGYDPVDLLQAPIKPPELQNTLPFVRRTQLFAILIGFIMAVSGIFLMLNLFMAWGAILMIIGAGAIAIATLVRL